MHLQCVVYRTESEALHCIKRCDASLCRWLSVRLEGLGSLAAFAAAVLAVEQQGSASLVGLTLSYALQITQLTSMTVRLASLAENSFNAVERVQEYCELEEEAAPIVDNSVPPGWPDKGEVRLGQAYQGYVADVCSDFVRIMVQCCVIHEKYKVDFVPCSFTFRLPQVRFEGVTMRYRAGLPLVLKGLNITIPHGTKCGVVGRTGNSHCNIGTCWRCELTELLNQGTSLCVLARICLQFQQFDIHGCWHRCRQVISDQCPIPADGSGRWSDLGGRG